MNSIRPKVPQEQQMSMGHISLIQRIGWIWYANFST